MYEYEINGKKYSQRKLVLGQTELLMDRMQGLVITGFSAPALIQSLKGRLLPVLAVVLLPEGCERIKDRDLDVIEADLEETPLETLMEVVEDFLSCNQPSSLLARLDAMIKQMFPLPDGSDSSSVS